MIRTPGPKTRRGLAVQLVLFAVPYGYVFVTVLHEFSRGRSGTLVAAVPALLVLLAGWIGYSGWAVRAYLRWSRGVRPAPARGVHGALVPRDIPLPPELLRSRRAIPAWARPRRWAGAAFGAAALLVNSLFALANDGGFMLRVGLAFTGAVLAVALPGVVLRRAERYLLANGTPVVATVSDVASLKGPLVISYDFETPAGPRTGTTTVDHASVVTRYGGWPEIGDPAFVVFDPHSLVKSALWSLPARRPGPAPGAASVVRVALWGLLIITFIVLYAALSRH